MDNISDILSYQKREELEQRIPELRLLRLTYIDLCHACARANISGINIEDTEKKRQSYFDLMIKRQHELLKKENINLASYQTDFVCNKCHDFGFIHVDGKRVVCDCRTQNQKVKFSNFPSFFDFDDSIYEDREQRSCAQEIRGELEDYALVFPKNDKPNILFFGIPGIGKTFFVQCITRALSERGIRTDYLPAYTVFDSFRKQHMGETEVMNRLSRIPFLAIDDLGVEPMYRNITIEYLNVLLDLRITRNLHTVIATNLDPKGLLERYGGRIASRILDGKSFSQYGLRGKDLRTKKRI